ncbi:hypothetical protein P7L78_17835 [Tistrella bauzanensis]|uniref:Lipoprotein n=1 Tax=Tistrella arctica TaxID=3133430 RepID=A0ABU9YDR8_9PROT
MPHGWSHSVKGFIAAGLMGLGLAGCTGVYVPNIQQIPETPQPLATASYEVSDLIWSARKTATTWNANYTESAIVSDRYTAALIGLAGGTVATLAFGAPADLSIATGLTAGLLTTTRDFLAPPGLPLIYISGVAALNCFTTEALHFPPYSSTALGDELARSASDMAARAAGTPEAAKARDRARAYEATQVINSQAHAAWTAFNNAAGTLSDATAFARHVYDTAPDAGTVRVLASVLERADALNMIVIDERKAWANHRSRLTAALQQIYVDIPKRVRAGRDIDYQSLLAGLQRSATQTAAAAGDAAGTPAATVAAASGATDAAAKAVAATNDKSTGQSLLITALTSLARAVNAVEASYLALAPALDRSEACASRNAG